MSGPARFVLRCVGLASVAGVSISCGASELDESTSALEGLCTVSPKAPILYFPLDLDPDTGLSFELARGLHAIVEGEEPGLSDVGSPLGPALALRGATALRTNDDIALDAPKGAFSVGAWVMADSIVGAHTIASRGVHGAPGSWRLAVVAAEADGPGDVVLEVCGPRGCEQAAMAKAMPLGEPHHVAAAVQLVPGPDGVTSEVMLRVAPIPGGDRAALEQRARLAVDLTSFDIEAPLMIGATDARENGVSVTTDHFIGVLDQLLVWDQAVDAATLAAIEGGIEGGGVCRPEPGPPPPPPLPTPPSISCSITGPAVLELRGGHTGADHTVTMGYSISNCPGCYVHLTALGTRTAPIAGASAYGGQYSMPGSGTHSIQATRHYAGWQSIGTWVIRASAQVFQQVNGQSVYVGTCQSSTNMRVTDTVPAGTWCGWPASFWQGEVDAMEVVMDDRSQTIAPQVFTAWYGKRSLLFGGSAGDTINGDWSRNCILGGGGADTLRGGGSKDWIEGNDGADLIEAGAGFDDLFGGSGADTIKGGDDGDDIFGGADGDIIYGDGGADHIRGEGGNDEIRGGSGNDTLWGNDGNDHLFGEGEGDALYGGANDDVLDGGANNDWIYGEDGNDTLRGGDHDDHLFCGPGRDKAKGDGGNDELEGGEGNDFLKGDGGDDDLSGENGIDRLCAGSGADTNDGGPDTDSCRGTPQTSCEVQASAGSCTDSAWNNY